MSDRGYLDELPPLERQMWEALAAEFGPKYAAQLMASSPGELVADMLSYELGYAVHPEDITPELAVTKLAMDQLYAQAKTAGLVSRVGALGTKALSSKAVGTAKSVGKAVWNNPAGKALTVGTAAAVPLTAGAMVAGNHVSNKIQNAGMVAGGANFLGATLGGALGSKLGSAADSSTKEAFAIPHAVSHAAGGALLGGGVGALTGDQDGVNWRNAGIGALLGGGAGAGLGALRHTPDTRTLAEKFPDSRNVSTSPTSAEVPGPRRDPSHLEWVAQAQRDPANRVRHQYEWDRTVRDSRQNNPTPTPMRTSLDEPTEADRQLEELRARIQRAIDAPPMHDTSGWTPPVVPNPQFGLRQRTPEEIERAQRLADFSIAASRSTGHTPQDLDILQGRPRSDASIAASRRNDVSAPAPAPTPTPTPTPTRTAPPDVAADAPSTPRPSREEIQAQRFAEGRHAFSLHEPWRIDRGDFDDELLLPRNSELNRLVREDLAVRRRQMAEDMIRGGRYNEGYVRHAMENDPEIARMVTEGRAARSTPAPTASTAQNRNHLSVDLDPGSGGPSAYDGGSGNRMAMLELDDTPTSARPTDSDRSNRMSMLELDDPPTKTSSVNWTKYNPLQHIDDMQHRFNAGRAYNRFESGDLGGAYDQWNKNKFRGSFEIDARPATRAEAGLAPDEARVRMGFQGHAHPRNSWVSTAGSIYDQSPALATAAVAGPALGLAGIGALSYYEHQNRPWYERIGS